MGRLDGLMPGSRPRRWTFAAETKNPSLAVLSGEGRCQGGGVLNSREGAATAPGAFGTGGYPMGCGGKD
jgi:hypothetical protein